MQNNTYVAVSLPFDLSHFTQGGFPSRDAAIEYIKSCLCQKCLEALEKGYEEWGVPEDTEVYEKSPVESPLDTSCGAEWLVLKEEDYEKCQDFKDLMIAAGGKIVWKIPEKE